MNKEKIQNKLGELFAQHRIVFWNDPDRDFEELLPSLGLSNVEILLADTIGQLKTKVILEIENPQGKFLVYSSAPEPQVEADWLLDIRLYSYQFRADAASLIVEELGLQHHQLREHIAKRSKFFGSQRGLRSLKLLLFRVILKLISTGRCWLCWPKRITTGFLILCRLSSRLSHLRKA